MSSGFDGCCLHLSEHCTGTADHVPDYLDLGRTVCDVCHWLAVADIEAEEALSSDKRMSTP